MISAQSAYGRRAADLAQRERVAAAAARARRAVERVLRLGRHPLELRPRKVEHAAGRRVHEHEIVRAAEVPPAPRLVEHEQQLQGPGRALGREERVAAVPQRGERRVHGRVLGRAARRRRRGRPTERARVADEHGGPPVGAAGGQRRAVNVAFPRVVDVPLVVRRARRPAAEVRAELGLPLDCKLLMFNFGGRVCRRTPPPPPPLARSLARS